MRTLFEKIKTLLKDFKHIKKFIKQLKLRTFPLFFTDTFAMRYLILYYDASFYVEDGQFIVFLEKLNLKFHLHSAHHTLGTLYGYFKDNPYSFCDDSNEYAVVDIGANIGDTALLFAKHENVKKVYAFEPFVQTYKAALDNIKLNPHLADKIELHNFGFSNEEKVSEIAFSYENSGGMTTDNNDYNKGLGKTETTKVELKNIRYLFEKILPSSSCENTACRIIMKLDCEGAEYKIFEEMDKENLFKYIDVIMLEWHHKGKEPLLKTLAKHNYFSWSMLECSSFGVLYSVKLDRNRRE
jgi:FkbM family methyltransferase